MLLTFFRDWYECEEVEVEEFICPRSPTVNLLDAAAAAAAADVEVWVVRVEVDAEP